LAAACNLGKRTAEALFEQTTTTQGTTTGSSSRATGRQATNACLSDDPARAAKEIRKEQKKAPVAGVTCHPEGGAWNSCGLSMKAQMSTIQNFRRACRGSVKCGWQKITKQ
jgi:hypothetical protein